MGAKTNTASSLLIMMIMGGGFISTAQGALADTNLGIQNSYWVGVACFAYLIFFAIQTTSLLKKEGVTIDNSSASTGH